MKKKERKQRSTPDDVTAIVQGLRRITRAIELYSHEVEREYGLTGPQLWALKNLQREGPLTPNRMAHSLAVDQSSVSGLLRRLERKGLVTRTRVPEDQRSVRIELTPEGRSLCRRAPEAAQGKLLHGLNGMSPARVRSLRRSVLTLVKAMEASAVTARFFFSDD